MNSEYGDNNVSSHEKTYHNRSIETTYRPESRRTYVCGTQFMAALGRPLSNTIYIFNRGFKV